METQIKHWNSLKACKILLLLLFLTSQIHPTNPPETAFGLYNVFYIHNDTLSFLDYTGHFCSNHIMSNDISFKYKTFGDTILCADTLKSNLEPISVYSPYINVDYVSFSDRTPNEYHYLKILNKPWLMNLSLPKKKFYPIEECTPEGWPRPRKLPNTAFIRDLKLLVLGLDFKLDNYWNSIPYIAQVVTQPKAKMSVYYNLEQILKSMRYVVRGDSMEIYDWKNNKLRTLYKNDSTFMSFYTKNEDGKSVLKQINHDSVNVSVIRP